MTAMKRPVPERFIPALAPRKPRSDDVRIAPNSSPGTVGLGRLQRIVTPAHEGVAPAGGFAVAGRGAGLLAADEADDAAHVAEVVGVWRGLEAQKLDGALANLDADGDAVANALNLVR